MIYLSIPKDYHTKSMRKSPELLVRSHGLLANLLEDIFNIKAPEGEGANTNALDADADCQPASE